MVSAILPIVYVVEFYFFDGIREPFNEEKNRRKRSMWKYV